MADEREEIARIIDPEHWAEADKARGKAGGSLVAKMWTEGSLAKADAILARAQGCEISQRGTVRGQQLEALQAIASGWSVIESDGRFITIKPPEDLTDQEVGELVVDTARAQGPGEAVAKKTMCLTLTDEEMAALEEVIKAKDATPKTIFRSALKLFQLEVRGFATVNVDLAATPTREA